MFRGSKTDFNVKEVYTGYPQNIDLGFYCFNVDHRYRINYKDLQKATKFNEID